MERGRSVGGTELARTIGSNCLGLASGHTGAVKYFQLPAVMLGFAMFAAACGGEAAVEPASALPTSVGQTPTAVPTEEPTVVREEPASVAQAEEAPAEPVQAPEPVEEAEVEDVEAVSAFAPGPFDDPLLELLAAMPVNEDGVYVLATITDVSQMLARPDIDRDAFCDAQSRDAYRYLPRGIGWGLNVSEFFQATLRAPERFESSFGFAFCQIEALASPNSLLSFARISKDSEAVLESLAQDPVWSPDLAVETVGAATVVDWGDEIEINKDPARRLGPGRMMIEGSTVNWGSLDGEPGDRRLDPDVRRVIDSPNVQTIVEQLRSKGAWTATLSDLPYESLSNPTLTLTQEEGESPFPQSLPGVALWITLGLGSVVDEGGHQVVAVFAHPSEEIAQANVDAFAALVSDGVNLDDTPWSDRIELMDIEADGLFVTATLRGAVLEDGTRQDPYALVIDALLKRETLFGYSLADTPGG